MQQSDAVPVLGYVALSLLLVVNPMSVEGQGAQARTSRVACFTVRPAPHCRSYWIVEVQGVVPIASSEQGFSRVFGDPVRPREVFVDNNLEINLGHMINVTHAVSVGAALVLGSNSGGVPDGARGRLRWWATPVGSLEVEAGIIRTNLGSLVGSPLMGPSVGVRLNYRDRGAVLLRYDRVRIPAEGTAWSGGAASGVSLGAAASGGGAVATGGLIALGMVALLLLLPAS